VGCGERGPAASARGGNRLDSGEETTCPAVCGPHAGVGMGGGNDCVKTRIPILTDVPVAQQTNVESSARAALHLLRGNGDTHPNRAAPSHLLEQRSVPTPDVQDPRTFAAGYLVQEEGDLRLLRVLVQGCAITVVEAFGVV
jgi:hypothetical protein